MTCLSFLGYKVPDCSQGHSTDLLGHDLSLWEALLSNLTLFSMKASHPLGLGEYLQGTVVHLHMIRNCLPRPLEQKQHEKKNHIFPLFKNISSLCLLSVHLVLNYQMHARSLD